jgi:hypothetical protein
MLRMLLAFALMLFVAAPASSATRTATFAGLSTDVLNPERGFYRSLADNFLDLTAEDMASIRREGATLTYALIRLDDFRTTDIPADTLARIDRQFAAIRKAGLKTVVRVSYNYPTNERDYLNAKDASLARVKTHISQLAPVIARNRDVIAVLQTGFIGAWGEGHTSSNKLDTAANKRIVMGELLAKMPKDLQILWRYPADLISWRATKLPSASRVGLHNDCFLSSPTDVGTYSDDSKLRASQRAQSATIARTNYYMGETCGAQPTAIRADCGSILREGKQFNVSSLNRDYYKPFAESWKAGKCYTTVAKSLGYRLRIVNASIAADYTFAVTIINDGWARPLNPRRVYLTWKTAAGKAMKTTLGTTSVRSLYPGTQITYRVKLAKNTGTFCLAVPDHAASLAKDPRYAIRFANANNTAKGQSWNAATGQFCFKL